MRDTLSCELWLLRGGVMHAGRQWLLLGGGCSSAACGASLQQCSSHKQGFFNGAQQRSSASAKR